VLLSWPVIVRVHPVHLMNVDWAPGGHQPSHQASQSTWAATVSLPKIVNYHLASISTIAIVIITQPVGWCSFYRPTEGDRLGRPRHCSKGAQPMPKAVYRSGYHDQQNRPRCDSDLDPLTRQSKALTTRPLRPANEYDTIVMFHCEWLPYASLIYSHLLQQVALLSS